MVVICIAIEFQNINSHKHLIIFVEFEIHVYEPTKGNLHNRRVRIYLKHKEGLLSREQAIYKYFILTEGLFQKASVQRLTVCHPSSSAVAETQNIEFRLTIIQQNNFI